MYMQLLHTLYILTGFETKQLHGLHNVKFRRGHDEREGMRGRGKEGRWWGVGGGGMKRVVQ